MLPHLTCGGSKTKTEKHAGVAITRLTKRLSEDLREPYFGKHTLKGCKITATIDNITKACICSYSFELNKYVQS